MKQLCVNICNYVCDIFNKMFFNIHSNSRFRPLRVSASPACRNPGMLDCRILARFHFSNNFGHIKKWYLQIYLICL